MGNRYIKEDIKKGNEFNNWTILKEVKGKYGRRFLCINSDGIKKEVNLCHLKSGGSKGYYNKDVHNANRKHGMSKTRIWNIWQHVKQRCINKNNQAYKYYGERGIKISKNWLEFDGFYKDMKEGYSDNLTIERIDVNRGYYKKNCKWIPQSQQGRNVRRNRYVEYDGKRLLLKDWSSLTGINYNTIYNRLYRYKFPLELVFSKEKLSGQHNNKRDNS